MPPLHPPSSDCIASKTGLQKAALAGQHYISSKDWPNGRRQPAIASLCLLPSPELDRKNHRDEFNQSARQPQYLGAYQFSPFTLKGANVCGGLRWAINWYA